MRLAIRLVSCFALATAALSLGGCYVDSGPAYAPGYYRPAPPPPPPPQGYYYYRGHARW